ncbi:MAG: hypothetical protein JWN13_1397 [Betaproteobacteria bacterium]|jgi:hypothetical protein|nr:hypothetical protein [Betaproteobacteria bacterium]MEA3156040.1 hypothetical protein [Betaproteobacteria bacterium]
MVYTNVKRWILLGLFGMATVSVHAQSTLRVRGTINDFDGSVLSVKSRDGKDLKLKLADNATIVAAKAMTLSDLKAGDYVGATTRSGPDGARVAVEIHTLAPTTPEGHGPWDLEPESMMTNANVASVESAGGQYVTLQYKGGSQKILVPQGTPIVTNTPVDRSYLKRGEYIFSIAQVGADGLMTVQRIQVSRDGVRPPQ